MPGFEVSLNGFQLITISTDGLNLLTVQVHGDMIGEEFASVYISGLGNDARENKYLIYLDQRPINSGDEVTIRLLEQPESSCNGKTIDELYPENEKIPGPESTVDQVFEELALKPRFREEYKFAVIPSNGEASNSCTKPDDHGFGFDVGWNWLHPTEAKVSLSSYSLKDLKNKADIKYHTKFRLNFDQSVKLNVNG